MIHMRTGAADYGARRARLPRQGPARGGGRPVVTAHAAGWGGIDAVTLDALGAFADAFAGDPEVRSQPMLRPGPGVHQQD
ncbi:hypothetical protein ACRAWD_30805 [Caulobacter segnis]